MDQKRLTSNYPLVRCSMFDFSKNYVGPTLNIIPTLYEGYIVSVHRMVIENRPVDPGSIQGSHRPISFIRIKHKTRADDILCKTE